MGSWNLAQFIASELAKENGLNKPEAWLAEEAVYLLNKYPELEEFVNNKSSVLSITEIISSFFKMLVMKKKSKPLYLRGIAPHKLKKLRLSHYLLAGFVLSTALKYCFNHRYNKDKFYIWEIDYTESRKAVLENLALKKISPDLSGVSKAGKGLRRKS